MGTYQKLFRGKIQSYEEAENLLRIIARTLDCEVRKIRLDCKKLGEYHTKFKITKYYGYPLLIRFWEIGDREISLISENGMLYILTGNPILGIIQIYKEG